MTAMKEPPQQAEAVRDDLPRSQERLGHPVEDTTAVTLTWEDPRGGLGAEEELEALADALVWPE